MAKPLQGLLRKCGRFASGKHQQKLKAPFDQKKLVLNLRLYSQCDNATAESEKKRIWIVANNRTISDLKLVFFC